MVTFLTIVKATSPPQPHWAPAVSKAEERLETSSLGSVPPFEVVGGSISFVGVTMLVGGSQSFIPTFGSWGPHADWHTPLPLWQYSPAWEQRKALGAAHHAEVQEITELFVRAHRCHSLRLVHRPARATSVRTGVGSPGLETALCGDTRDRWGERYETVDK